MLREMQTRFAETLLRPPSQSGDRDVLADLDVGGIGGAERLAVYRTNVQASLIEVLLAAFPVTAALAGEKNFRFAASRYLRGEPPNQARLLAYGEGFAAWLAAFEPAAGQPWLAEMARLEWARNEALFAADAEPLDAQILTRLSADEIPELAFVAHPATRLLRFDYRLDRPWRLAQEGKTIPVPEAGEESVLVRRPGLAVEQIVLSPGDAAMAAALLDGRSLSKAAEAALAVEAGLDLQATLFGHLSGGTFSAFRRSDAGSG